MAGNRHCRGSSDFGRNICKCGWQTVHFGKTHDQGALWGFVCEPEREVRIAEEEAAFPLNVDSFRDAYTVEAAAFPGKETG